MSEPSTTASAFEPDFEAAAIHIEKWALELLGSEKAVASARNIYADCQRQAAAAGLVMVRREAIVSIRDELAELADWVALAEAPDIDETIRTFVRALDFAINPGPFAFIPGGYGDTSSPDDDVDEIREPWGPAPWQ